MRRDPFGVEPAQLPDHHGAPVVADEGGLVVAVVVEQAAQVGRQLVGAVVASPRWEGAAAVATLVGGDGPVAGIAQRGESDGARSTRARGSHGTSTTGVPSLGPAVATCSSMPLDGICSWVITDARQTWADFAAFSSWCFWMADITALPAAPMNCGRFSAAQSRLAVSDLGHCPGTSGPRSGR